LLEDEDMYSILKNAKISIQALKAADNETLTGNGVDMQGFDSVIFVAGAMEGEALNFALKAQQAAASDYSDAADLAGTNVAFSTGVSTRGLSSLEIVQPGEQYVRPVITVPNAVAATPTFCLAIQFNAKDVPQVNAGELHVTPAEGTA
jgi:hypothetical protein